MKRALKVALVLLVAPMVVLPVLLVLAVRSLYPRCFPEKLRWPRL